jgi:hypothetical protein
MKTYARVVLSGLLSAAALTLAGAPSATALDFAPTASFDLPFVGAELAVADVDGDGRDDLVVPLGIGAVSVFKGDGHGSFAQLPGHPVAVGDSTEGVATGDVDGDGALDLAVTDVLGRQVHVLLGDGEGGFTPAPDSPLDAGQMVFQAVLADLDGDGDDDLVWGNLDDDTASVLLSDGDGTFTPAPGSPVPTGEQPQDVVAVDVDGDDVLDLLAAGSEDGTVTVLLGDGDGTFTPATGSPLSVGIWPKVLAPHDLDGDGDPDLVVADTRTGRLHVLLGAGDGTFAPKTDFYAGSRPWSVSVGDLNRDGRADLAVALHDEPRLHLYLGDGQGRFGEAAGSPLPVAAGIDALALHDFDGDALPDLATGNVLTRTLELLRNVSAAPSPLNAPTVSGSAAPGTVVRCLPGAWSGSAVVARSTRWLRDGVALDGADSESLGVTAADRGHQLACEERVVNELGTATAVSLPVTVPAAPAPPDEPPPGGPGTEHPSDGQPGVGQPGGGQPGGGQPGGGQPGGGQPGGGQPERGSVGGTGQAPTGRRAPVVRLARGPLKVRGGAVAVTLRCLVAGRSDRAERCRGTLVLARRAGGAVLARTRVTVVPGRCAVVRVRLSPAARRALAAQRATGRVVVAVKLADGSGGRASTVAVRRVAR